MNSIKIKFLIDVGVGKGIENYLHADGYDIKAVRDIDPCLEDEKIIRTAFLENRMVISMDKDFRELAYHSLMEHSGVLLLRLEDATGSKKLKVSHTLTISISFNVPIYLYIIKAIRPVDIGLFWNDGNCCSREIFIIILGFDRLWSHIYYTKNELLNRPELVGKIDSGSCQKHKK